MTPASTGARQPVIRAGAPLGAATAAGILLHGRGASAADIIGLAGPLTPAGPAGQQVAWLAPQAAGSVWYPHRFTEPIALNQEALAAALRVVDGLFAEVLAAGIPSSRVLLAGFSQGACLALEYAWRGQHRPGAVGALSGGLIGHFATDPRPAADLTGLPIFIGMGDADQVVPISQIAGSVPLLEAAGAEVTYDVYPGLGHSVIKPEIDALRGLLAALVPPVDE